MRASLLQSSCLSGSVHILQTLYAVAGATGAMDIIAVVSLAQPTAGSSAWGVAGSSHVYPGVVGWGVPQLWPDGLACLVGLRVFKGVAITGFHILKASDFLLHLWKNRGCHFRQLKAIDQFLAVLLSHFCL